jgi:hypothetical protein
MFAAVRQARSNMAPRRSGPVYLLAYVLLALVTAGMIWLPFATFGSGHGNPLIVFVVVTWPIGLYILFRSQRDEAGRR